MEYGGYTTVSPGSTTAHRDGDRAWTFPRWEGQAPGADRSV